MGSQRGGGGVAVDGMTNEFSGAGAALQQATEGRTPEDLAGDEAFWARVRAEFVTPADYIHLEYGYYHPACRAVLAAEIATMTMAQREAAHYKRTGMSADREAARADLARLAGADQEEVVIARNATEAMNIVIMGLPLRAGDEIVYSNLDYGSVVEALEQRARRDGLTLRQVTLPPPEAGDAGIVARFAAAFTPQTRAVVLTHVINHTGQVLPVRELCALARARGVETIVDAAHAFAQLAFTVDELGCDYLGASLHKWLAAPLGTGLLYVRKEKIAALAPLFGDTTRAATDVRKLEHFGNRPDSAHVGLREAIRWHTALGTPVKSARLRCLQRRWTVPARALPRVRVLTPAEPERHGAIGVFAIEGLAPKQIVETLMTRYGIFVNAIEHPDAAGVRVTPGVMTRAEDIDQLVAALREIAGQI